MADSAGVEAVDQQPDRALSAASLTNATLDDLGSCFFVPTYQRGYRWGSEEVLHLLDDVWASAGKPYSLQPVVVKLHVEASDPAMQEWELVDGQQRLTTLYLILRYMQEELKEGMGAPYSLRYATRESSANYLATISLSQQGDVKNIDYAHMHSVYQAIHAWFARHGERATQKRVAERLRSYLFGSVRIIRYAAPADMAGIPLFRRLNVGRIPLTSAELVKAALLSGTLQHTAEIATQWDAIERDLHDPHIWGFVSGLASDVGDTVYPTRISLLLDALADAIKAPAAPRDRYHTFDVLLPAIRQDGKAFWDDVVALHAQIIGWHRQPAISNAIGYLVATGFPFASSNSMAKDLRKSQFANALLKQIRLRMKTTEEQLATLSYLQHRAKLMDILLLLNVQTASDAQQHFPFSRHAAEHWSLEHIHAQNAEDLNKSEQWKTWLDKHWQAVSALGTSPEILALTEQISAEMDDIDAGKGSRERFKTLSEHILALLNRDADTDHLIHNLALLSSAHNSSLSNSVFEVKRQMIIDIDRSGGYVPPATRNVFLKYYTGADAQQAHFWSEQDKVAYAAEIRARLQPFLSESKGSS